MTARRAARLALGLVLAGYVATGLIVIQPDEQGVVRRFGAARREPYLPGLHWGLPWGLERVDRVKTDQARTITVGARDLLAAPLSQAPNPATDDFLTSDLNLVSAQALVQFRLSDPVRYLFNARSADSTLAALAESALTDALAQRPIDDALTAGRTEIAEQMRGTLQALADRHELGVTIRAVRLGRVVPPAAVAPAFADAARARSDKRQTITRAEEYRDKAEADARGQAREIADRAAGRHETVVQAARGEADRFAKLLAGVKGNPEAARRRLYLETLTQILPRLARTVVVAPGEAVDLSLFTGEGAASTTPSKPNAPEPPSGSVPR